MSVSESWGYISIGGPSDGDQSIFRGILSSSSGTFTRRQTVKLGAVTNR